MVFQSCADNLALIIKIFRANKSDHAGFTRNGSNTRVYAISASFERKLVHAVMGFSRKRTALSSLKIHDVRNLLLVSVLISGISVYQW